MKRIKEHSAKIQRMKNQSYYEVYRGGQNSVLKLWGGARINYRYFWARWGHR